MRERGWLRGTTICTLLWFRLFWAVLRPAPIAAEEAVAGDEATTGETPVPAGDKGEGGVPAGPSARRTARTDAPVLTLDQAQAEARRHNPDVAVWSARVAGARGAAEVAARWIQHDPTLSLVSRPPRFLQNQNEHLWDISLSMPVGPVSASKFRRDAATRSLARQRFEMADRLAALDEAVARSVADLAFSQRALDRARRSVELAEAFVTIVAPGDQGSPAQRLEADSALWELWTARARVADARAGLARARRRLARLLGRTQWADLVVADTFSPPRLPPEPDFDRLVERDPRVLARVADLEALRASFRYQERMARPTPVAGISYGRGPWGFLADNLGIPSDATADNKPQVAFTLFLNLPLFERNRTARTQAAAQLAIAEATLRAARSDVRADLETRWDELVRAARVLDALQHVPRTIQRDIAAVQQMTEQGTMSPGERVRWLKYVEAAAADFDSAVRQWRYAEAAWRRAARE